MEDRTLADLFGLVFPDFGALFRGELAGTNALIILILFAIAAAFGFYVVQYSRRARARIHGLRQLVDPLDPSALVTQRERVRADAQDSDVQAVRDLWREFDETLVESPDGSTLWNTLDAEHFVNTQTLAPELIHNRLLTATPAILTAIGVLGTFVGLTTGLNGLELRTSANVEQLKSGIDTLIAGASIAFMTSVWGVFLSLIGNVVEKAVERQIVRQISTLEHDIDRIFKRHPPEQSLVKIMGSTEEAAVSLQELHERIGNQLQEAVRGLSENLEAALITAIESAMSPAMSSLVDSTAQQSTAVFEKLVDQFTAGFQKIGETQAQKLDDASSGVSEAIQTMSVQFESMMEKMDASVSAQQDEMAARSEQFRGDLDELVKLSAEQRNAFGSALDTILGELKQAANRISESGTSLESASRDLSSVSTSMSSTADALTRSFSTSLGKMEELTQQQESAASMFWEYANQLNKLQETMDSTATNLEAAAKSSGEGFVALREHQDAFLASLRTEFLTTNKSLKSNVDDLRTSMAEWLREYSQEVSSQVSKRMDEWNTQTMNYAEGMVRVAQALSDAVEELEVQR